jgi:hypothetical protein
MVPKVRKRAEEAGTEPGLSPEVAAQLVDEVLGKVRAEQAARGGVNPATARELLGEQRVKFAGQEQGRGKRREQAQAAAVRPAIAQDVMFRSGGMATPEQAEHGAERYQALIHQGVRPEVAADRVMAELFKLLQQQDAWMQQQGAMNQGMLNMLQQGHQRMGVHGMNQNQMQGQMQNMRVQRAWPWNTIGG